jgi:hypothetical protein
MKVRLETKLGEFVAEVDCPPFILLPDVLMWSSRFFTHYESVNISSRADEPVYSGVIYREGFCYVVTPPDVISLFDYESARRKNSL